MLATNFSLVRMVKITVTCVRTPQSLVMVDFDLLLLNSMLLQFTKIGHCRTVKDIRNEK